MAMYRDALPQLSNDFFLADAGLETTLSFLEGIEIPLFASFTVLGEPDGRAALRRYFDSYAALARRFECGLELDTATWRCNPDWGEKLGYGASELAETNRESVRQLEEVRAAHASPHPIVISGCLGPRGDGYVPSAVMSADEAAAYHAPQIETFADTAADLVGAATMNYVEEAVGITRAAERAGMPVVISFTVETNGCLPTGQGLGAAIEQVEEETGQYPAYYMINCAHPTHFESTVARGGAWTERIQGIAANASCMSHAELDEASELDIGDPAELGAQYASLRQHLPQLNVMGGCCGTDIRHIEEIAVACRPLFEGGG
ncbi:MAG: homocysteine S-methyltransferase family protein [Deltaproteobacteria bacterium]|nr:homocysteine S-methyltransferase family protein [Deltaproteobacteria bacterium]